MGVIALMNEALLTAHPKQGDFPHLANMPGASGTSRMNPGAVR